MLELNDYEKYSAPARKGPYFFFSRNSGLQNQSVLFVQGGIDGAPEVLIDPNTWSADGTVGLSVFAPSKDATYAVYGISRSGSDWQQFKVMHLASKATLDDTLEWVKVSGVAWHGDGFFYSRYPAPPAGQEKASINENHQVFFHRLGTPQSQDRLVYEDAANPQRFHTLQTTEDERFAILTISERGKGKDGNALHVCDLSRGAPRLHAARRHHHRRLVRRRSTTSATSCSCRPTAGRRTGASCSSIRRTRRRAAGRTCWPNGRSRCRVSGTAGGKLFAHLPPGRDVARLRARPRWDARERGRAAGAGCGGRLCWFARRHVRLLLVQLAERAADHLPLRHRVAHERRLPSIDRARLRPRGVCHDPGVLRRARTARACRCSWSTARA